MTFDAQQHHRRSIRLEEYDYSQAGAYFVTVGVQSRRCLLGEVVGSVVRLKRAGHMVQTVWQGLPERFPFVTLDQFVVMPNHVHGIMILTEMACRGESRIRPVPSSLPGHEEGDHKDRPYGTLPDTVGRIIQAFKSVTTHDYTIGVKEHGWAPFRRRLWQRNYYERVIRNEEELNAIRQYVIDNPAQWAFDRENPAREASGPGAGPGAPADEIERIFQGDRP